MDVHDTQVMYEREQISKSTYCLHMQNVRSPCMCHVDTRYSGASILRETTQLPPHWVSPSSQLRHANLPRSHSHAANALIPSRLLHVKFRRHTLSSRFRAPRRNDTPQQLHQAITRLVHLWLPLLTDQARLTRHVTARLSEKHHNKNGRF